MNKSLTNAVERNAYICHKRKLRHTSLTFSQIVKVLYLVSEPYVYILRIKKIDFIDFSCLYICQDLPCFVIDKVFTC